MNRTEEFMALVDGASAVPERLSGSVTRARARYRRRRAPLRVVLAAACLCALLVGTTLGAKLILPQVKETVSGEERSAYYVGGNMAQRPMERLSAELNRDLAAGAIRRTWENRAELERYLGVTLLSGPELEQAGMVETLEEAVAYGWKLDSALAEYPDARYVLTGLTLEGEPEEGAPEQLKVSAYHVIRNTEVLLRTQIVTEYADPAELEAGLLGMEFAPTNHIFSHVVYDGQGGYTWEWERYQSAEQEFTAEIYEMACGIHAVIVTAEGPVNPFYKDGPWVEPLHGFREYQGYFIYDGALYTIYPYAVYDPNLSDPSENSDMLTVLKHVLDSFVLPEK